ncbi:hypothetical protein LTR37_007791 [Vermiconidia calcicola]|uniref:Uncharacterized protein n=1 Tax=Vermiconidia calcicola TaxID=1690605 RepID=A0ACC3NCX9_9PEZI|nr:hypothetical protein LTR37_007791 [Vermiconidia calcicola]
MYSDKLWRSRYLITLWVAQLFFLIIFLLILALYMMEIAGRTDGDVGAILPTTMTLLCFALVMMPLEMVFQSYRLLEPWLFLAFQIYKVLFGTIFTILLIAGYARTDYSGPGSWLEYIVIATIVFAAGMTVSFWCALAYGIVILRRHRKGGYHNVKGRSGKE